MNYGLIYQNCHVDVTVSLQVGIELSKTAAVHWSDDDMKKALESVRSGGMSINQVLIEE